jgi:dihydrofolate reductase
LSPARASSSAVPATAYAPPEVKSQERLTELALAGGRPEYPSRDCEILTARCELRLGAGVQDIGPAAASPPADCSRSAPTGSSSSPADIHRVYPWLMRPLRYSINVTLDVCCDHRAIVPDEDLHRHAAENLHQADALLFGQVTYEMMEAAWRSPAGAGLRPDWMEPFSRTIDAAKKYVLSSTLDRVDWNAELVRVDLETAVQQLKRESGKGLLTGGVKLPLALAECGLIDEYEFVVQPRIAGHGPTLFAGLSKPLDLRLVSRLEFGSGAVAMRYEPRR